MKTTEYITKLEARHDATVRELGAAREELDALKVRHEALVIAFNVAETLNIALLKRIAALEAAASGAADADAWQEDRSGRFLTNFSMEELPVYERAVRENPQYGLAIRTAARDIHGRLIPSWRSLWRTGGGPTELGPFWVKFHAIQTEIKGAE